jgi:hypothetical protein
MRANVLYTCTCIIQMEQLLFDVPLENLACIRRRHHCWWRTAKLAFPEGRGDGSGGQIPPFCCQQWVTITRFKSGISPLKVEPPILKIKLNSRPLPFEKSLDPPLYTTLSREGSLLCYTCCDTRPCFLRSHPYHCPQWGYLLWTNYHTFEFLGR